MTRLMYDSVTATDIPDTAKMVGGYCNGSYKWSDADWARFPSAVKLRISTYLVNDGDILDVEKYDANPSDAPQFIRWRMAAGVARPGIYCNRSTFPAVQAACNAAPPGLNWAWWGADPTGQPHPLASASAVQYAWPEYGSGGHFDLTMVYDDTWFPSPAPQPAPQPTEPVESWWQWMAQHHGWHPW